MYFLTTSFYVALLLSTIISVCGQTTTGGTGEDTCITDCSSTAAKQNLEAAKACLASTDDDEAHRFRGFFAPIAKTNTSSAASQASAGGPQPNADAPEDSDRLPQVIVLAEGDKTAFYLSDLSDSDSGSDSDTDGNATDDEDEGDWYEVEDARPSRSVNKTQREAVVRVRPPPAPKRRKLDVSVREMRAQAAEKKRTELENALKDLRRLLRSKNAFKDTNGASGLQAYRARAIESTLIMLLHHKRRLIDASQRAAESHKFAPRWGGRLVRGWLRTWVKKCELPTSRRGRHAKVWSLLDDPNVANEIRTYLRSNKWAVDPKKLSDFTAQKLVPDAADKYLQQIIRTEMPSGLKKYLELELFPRVHFKVGKGISLRTARRWMHKEGFRYLSFKKGLYYDGHERPDVVHYRQSGFLPKMAEHRKRLVEYVVGDVEKEVSKERSLAERPLVLVAHDEMTAQAHNGKRAGWILEGEQPLRKKGAGRGLHQSDVICSTFGWVKDASVTLEYGKNHEGFWTGELFVKQLSEKIIPALEDLHGPGFQFLIMVDNSQGHAAYSADALLAQNMNLNPGGKQARMRDGWYTGADGTRVSQPMVFPPNHPTYPDMPKGMKQVLLERGLWRSRLLMKCKNGCEPEATDCCALRLLKEQPDFQAQTSLVQEVIEAAGHLCIFLPKFHCELNFIEYFWGAVKRVLREQCDYSFEGLKQRMPEALQSVPVETIRRWEHRMVRWMDAYRNDLDAKSAQQQVRAFSSRKYKSHRRVPEAVARSFDV